MIKKSLLLIVFLIAIIAIPIVSAQSGHMTLLAVSEEGTEEYKGSTADLYLEIKPGNNNIYMDTFPLTKLDTQLSTRFAKEIACKTLNKDCNKLNFFYKIKAGSLIIGGPSAGAAIAVLTATMLDNNNIDESVSITGTINTGGLIGSVSGIKEKIDAAAEHGLKKVLIPIGTRYQLKINESKLNKSIEEIDNKENSTTVDIDKQKDSITITITTNDSNGKEDNKSTTITDSTDLVEYGKSKGIEVIEVTTIDDALFHFTGKEKKKTEGKLEEKGFYTETMSFISRDLCNRTEDLKSKITKGDILNNSEYKKAEELLNNSKIVFKENQYYSGASFCFGANIIFDNLILIQENTSLSKKLNQIDKIMNAINQTNEALDKTELVSIIDLQTFMIMKERIIEAHDSLRIAEESIDNNDTDINFEIAYATERLYSALSWGHFLNKSDVKFNINDDVMKKSCESKLNEAQERKQYLDIIAPYLELKEIEDELSRAYLNEDNSQYIMCLMHASKAKAQIDSILGAAGVDESVIGKIVEAKIELVEEVLLQQQQKGLFPIQGYSYYQYAKTLSNTDNISALIYSEYALEFSNLDHYFEKVEVFDQKEWFLEYYVVFIGAGTFIVGVFVGILLVRLSKNRYTKNEIRKDKKINKKKKK